MWLTPGLPGLRKFSLRAVEMRTTMSFWLICIVMEPLKFYGIHQSFPAEKSNKKRDLKTACSFSIMKTAKKKTLKVSIRLWILFVVVVVVFPFTSGLPRFS